MRKVSVADKGNVQLERQMQLPEKMPAGDQFPSTDGKINDNLAVPNKQIILMLGSTGIARAIPNISAQALFAGR